jgi:hypothetical protein
MAKGPKGRAGGGPRGRLPELGHCTVAAATSFLPHPWLPVDTSESMEDREGTTSE